MAQTDNNVNTFENTVNLPKAKKINKFENVVIAPNDNNVTNVITLPKSTILAKNIKVMILSPLGIIALFLALVSLFGSVRAPGAAIFNLFCGFLFGSIGIYLLLPAIYYKSDIENKKYEHYLKITNQILPNQSITNPSKSRIGFLLESLIVLFLVVFVVLVVVFILSGGWLMILLLLSGGGGAFG